ncbi:unnamed protein product [Coccothraustes coccothraustes]
MPEPFPWSQLSLQPQITRPPAREQGSGRSEGIDLGITEESRVLTKSSELSAAPRKLQPRTDPRLGFDARLAAGGPRAARSAPRAQPVAEHASQAEVNPLSPPSSFRDAPGLDAGGPNSPGSGPGARLPAVPGRQQRPGPLLPGRGGEAVPCPRGRGYLGGKKERIIFSTSAMGGLPGASRRALGRPRAR